MEITITLKLDEKESLGRIIHITPPTVEPVDPPEHEGMYRMSESKGKFEKVEYMNVYHLLNALKKDLKGKDAKDVIETPIFQEMFRVLSIATLP